MESGGRSEGISWIVSKGHQSVDNVVLGFSELIRMGSGNDGVIYMGKALTKARS